MKKMAVLICMVPFLFGCTNSAITILTDPIWNSVQPGYTAGDIQILEVNLDRNILQSISTEISRLKNKTVILSPFLSAVWYEGSDEVLPQNVLLMTPLSSESYDERKGIAISRTEAYKKSGKLFGKLISDSESAFYGKIAGAVFYTGTEERRREMAAFREGFYQFSQPAQLALYQLESVENQAAINSPVQEMKTRDIQLVLLSASRLNRYVMERMDEKKVRIIVEQGLRIEKYGEMVFGSLEFSIKDLINYLAEKDQDAPFGLLTTQLVLFDESYSF